MIWRIKCIWDCPNLLKLLIIFMSDWHIKIWFFKLKRLCFHFFIAWLLWRWLLCSLNIRHTIFIFFYFFFRRIIYLTNKSTCWNWLHLIARTYILESQIQRSSIGIIFVKLRFLRWKFILDLFTKSLVKIFLRIIFIIADILWLFCWNFKLIRINMISLTFKTRWILLFLSFF